MIFTENLEVFVYLFKNEAALLTQRLKIQPWSTFLSNLAGSILGILGTVGFVMNLIEDKYEIYLKNKKQIKNFKSLKRGRIEILEKNMNTKEKSENKLEPPQDTCRDLISSTDYINAIETSQV